MQHFQIIKTRRNNNRKIPERPVDGEALPSVVEVVDAVEVVVGVVV